MSRTPAVLLIASPWLVGIAKNSDVERTVTIRVDELASVAALKPSSTARNAEKRNTATATLITVSAVRRLLRRAPLKIKPMNFMSYLPDPPDPPDAPDPPDRPDLLGLSAHRDLLDQRAL